MNGMADAKRTVVAVTGSAGAMGSEIVAHLLDSDKDFELRLFINNRMGHLRSFFRRLLKRGKKRMSIIRGNLGNYNEVEKLVSGADYVIHCGALIPPKADHDPENTIKTNFGGTKNIVDAIMNSGRADKIKMVHISTVAVYGNRDHKHPWARMGDPVMSSPYDYYSASKIKAERYVLESALPNWVILRQTAVYHKYFLVNNLSDGLMFHTCWNAPLEWITDRDSGLCIKNLVEKDIDGKLGGFWKKNYNIGGGKSCRETGYETFSSVFALMGAETERIFNPEWNIPRNFHGVWFTDSDILNDWLGYRTENIHDYWKRMKEKLWYYRLGYIIPSFFIRKFAIERLLKNSNAPMNWIRLGKKGRIDAFFGGQKAFDELPREWKNFPLLKKGQSPDGSIDYEALKDEKQAERYKLNHGYDDAKPDTEIGMEDLKSAAEYRGGKVITDSMKEGDIYAKIVWQCHNGHRFENRAYTVLRCGFWCPECCEALPKWSFDKAAKHVPFYAQVWYDTHRKDEENNVYPYDEHEDDDMIVLSK